MKKTLIAAGCAALLTLPALSRTLGEWLPATSIRRAS